MYPADEDKIIQRDTENYVTDYLSENWPDTEFLVLPVL